ncbi:phospholipase D-like domain-containing protein, partial [Actinoallomurus sp. NPDC050550]|uniref:phospholipase D-like domain-containing protein n=1 Tax=Actinoallomurus sp. NPDC050550 TaxID=3154937 RepID=UPI0033F41353
MPSSAQRAGAGERGVGERSSSASRAGADPSNVSRPEAGAGVGRGEDGRAHAASESSSKELSTEDKAQNAAAVQQRIDAFIEHQRAERWQEYKADRDGEYATELKIESELHRRVDVGRDFDDHYGRFKYEDLFGGAYLPKDGHAWSEVRASYLRDLRNAFRAEWTRTGGHPGERWENDYARLKGELSDRLQFFSRRARDINQFRDPQDRNEGKSFEDADRGRDPLDREAETVFEKALNAVRKFDDKQYLRETEKELVADNYDEKVGHYVGRWEGERGILDDFRATKRADIAAAYDAAWVKAGGPPRSKDAWEHPTPTGPLKDLHEKIERVESSTADELMTTVEALGRLEQKGARWPEVLDKVDRRKFVEGVRVAYDKLRAASDGEVGAPAADSSFGRQWDTALTDIVDRFLDPSRFWRAEFESFQMERGRQALNDAFRESDETPRGLSGGSKERVSKEWDDAIKSALDDHWTSGESASAATSSDDAKSQKSWNERWEELKRKTLPSLMEHEYRKTEMELRNAAHDWNRIAGDYRGDSEALPKESYDEMLGKYREETIEKYHEVWQPEIKDTKEWLDSEKRNGNVLEAELDDLAYREHLSGQASGTEGRRRLGALFKTLTEKDSSAEKGPLAERDPSVERDSSMLQMLVDHPAASEDVSAGQSVDREAIATSAFSERFKDALADIDRTDAMRQEAHESVESEFQSSKTEIEKQAEQHAEQFWRSIRERGVENPRQDFENQIQGSGSEELAQDLQAQAHSDDEWLLEQIAETKSRIASDWVAAAEAEKERFADEWAKAAESDAPDQVTAVREGLSAAFVERLEEYPRLLDAHETFSNKVLVTDHQEFTHTFRDSSEVKRFRDDFAEAWNGLGAVAESGDSELEGAREALIGQFREKVTEAWRQGWTNEQRFAGALRLEDKWGRVVDLRNPDSQMGPRAAQIYKHRIHQLKKQYFEDLAAAEALGEGHGEELSRLDSGVQRAARRLRDGVEPYATAIDKAVDQLNANLDAIGARLADPVHLASEGRSAQDDRANRGNRYWYNHQAREVVRGFARDVERQGPGALERLHRDAVQRLVALGEVAISRSSANQEFQRLLDDWNADRGHLSYQDDRRIDALREEYIQTQSLATSAASADLSPVSAPYGLETDGWRVSAFRTRQERLSETYAQILAEAATPTREEADTTLEPEQPASADVDGQESEGRADGQSSARRYEEYRARLDQAVNDAAESLGDNLDDVGRQLLSAFEVHDAALSDLTRSAVRQRLQRELEVALTDKFASYDSVDAPRDASTRSDQVNKWFDDLIKRVPSELVRAIARDAAMAAASEQVDQAADDWERAPASAHSQTFMRRFDLEPGQLSTDVYVAISHSFTERSGAEFDKIFDLAGDSATLSAQLDEWHKFSDARSNRLKASFLVESAHRRVRQIASRIFSEELESWQSLSDDHMLLEDEISRVARVFHQRVLSAFASAFAGYTAEKDELLARSWAWDGELRDLTAELPAYFSLEAASGKGLEAAGATFHGLTGEYETDANELAEIAARYRRDWFELFRLFLAPSSALDESWLNDEEAHRNSFLWGMISSDPDNVIISDGVRGDGAPQNSNAVWTAAPGAGMLPTGVPDHAQVPTVDGRSALVVPMPDPHALRGDTAGIAPVPSGYQGLFEQARRIVEDLPANVRERLLAEAAEIVAFHHAPLPVDMTTVPQERREAHEGVVLAVAELLYREDESGVSGDDAEAIEAAHRLAEELAETLGTRRRTGGAPPGSARPPVDPVEIGGGGGPSRSSIVDDWIRQSAVDGVSRSGALRNLDAAVAALRGNRGDVASLRAALHAIDEWRTTKTGPSRRDDAVNRLEAEVAAELTRYQDRAGITVRSRPSSMSGLDASPATRAAIEELEGRYFPPGMSLGVPHRADTAVTPHIDGASYFAAIADVLDTLGQPGDRLYITSWYLHLATRLRHRAGEPNLGERLIALAEAGVDVRVVVAIPRHSLSPFEKPFPQQDFWRWPIAKGLSIYSNTNLNSVRTLRGAHRDGRAVLANRVLIDWGGAFDSRHEKSTVAYHAATGQLHAFVGGMDYAPNRLGAEEHSGAPNHNYWHDLGVQLVGGAAEEVLSNFWTRWDETATLPNRTYWHERTQEPYNPAIEPTPHQLTPPRSAEPTRSSADSHVDAGIRVWRSYAKHRVSPLTDSLRLPWATLPPEGVSEIADGITGAIGAAERYVYVEDQTLNPSSLTQIYSHHDFIFPAVARALARGVKVVFVTQGFPGRDQPSPDATPNISSEINALILDGLSAEQRQNFALFVLTDTKIHSKLVLVDDEFASIGSANFWDRSMRGNESEVTAAIVHPGGPGSLVADLRVRLWREHLRMPDTASTDANLRNLEVGLGYFRRTWGSGTAAEIPDTALEEIRTRSRNRSGDGSSAQGDGPAVVDSVDSTAMPSDDAATPVQEPPGATPLAGTTRAAEPTSADREALNAADMVVWVNRTLHNDRALGWAGGPVDADDVADAVQALNAQTVVYPTTTPAQAYAIAHQIARGTAPTRTRGGATGGLRRNERERLEDAQYAVHAAEYQGLTPSQVAKEYGGKYDSGRFKDEEALGPEFTLFKDRWYAKKYAPAGGVEQGSAVGSGGSRPGPEQAESSAAGARQSSGVPMAVGQERLDPVQDEIRLNRARQQTRDAGDEGLAVSNVAKAHGNSHDYDHERFKEQNALGPEFTLDEGRWYASEHSPLKRARDAVSGAADTGIRISDVPRAPRTRPKRFAHPTALGPGFRLVYGKWYTEEHAPGQEEPLERAQDAVRRAAGTGLTISDVALTISAVDYDYERFADPDALGPEFTLFKNKWYAGGYLPDEARAAILDEQRLERARTRVLEARTDGVLVSGVGQAFRPYDGRRFWQKDALGPGFKLVVNRWYADEYAPAGSVGQGVVVGAGGSRRPGPEDAESSAAGAGRSSWVPAPVPVVGSSVYGVVGSGSLMSPGSLAGVLSTGLGGLVEWSGIEGVLAGRGLVLGPVVFGGDGFFAALLGAAGTPNLLGGLTSPAEIRERLGLLLLDQGARDALAPLVRLQAEWAVDEQLGREQGLNVDWGAYIGLLEAAGSPEAAELTARREGLIVEATGMVLDSVAFTIVGPGEWDAVAEGIVPGLAAYAFGLNIEIVSGSTGAVEATYGQGAISVTLVRADGGGWHSTTAAYPAGGSFEGGSGYGPGYFGYSGGYNLSFRADTSLSMIVGLG